MESKPAKREIKFGHNLKVLMATNHINSAVVAREVGVPKSSISEWVTHNQTPQDLNALKSVAEFFHVSVHFLVWGEEDKNSREQISMQSSIQRVKLGNYEIAIRTIDPQ